MMLDLTDEETDALARLLSRTIDNDRYPLSPRIQNLKGILAKIRPEPVREPVPHRRSMRHREPRVDGAARFGSAEIPPTSAKPDRRPSGGLPRRWLRPTMYASGDTMGVNHLSITAQPQIGKGSKLTGFVLG
jgi:hypothetical protein